ncbi:hypothetical protein CMI37_03720 [Candidatus Pacearchaeota archaeon]|nr:hypothetical protein [Candidatus Pacearchaeota archaeon]
MPQVRLSQAEDCVSLAGQLRSADLKELQAHGVTPEKALTVGYEASTPCYTIEHEGEPVAMFGVSPLTVGVPKQTGAVWLLGSDRIKDIRTRFLRESRQWLEEISKPYALLANVVHEENALHIRWLQFLGFTFVRKVSPFIEFARIS